MCHSQGKEVSSWLEVKEVDPWWNAPGSDLDKYVVLDCSVHMTDLININKQKQL